MKICSLTFVVLCACLVCRAATKISAVPWMALDEPHPYCERRVALDVADDFFYPIANNLPGSSDYNDLIVLFQKKKWEQLDRAIEVFEKTFEHSALREAIAFLAAQSMFDRVQGADDSGVREAEKSMREALLLYPKSTLAPVLGATAGNFWLRTGNFERALSIYKASLIAYPEHPLNCIFRMGLAESGFMMHDWKIADDSLRDIVTQCRNFRLRTAALLRQAESRWLRGEAGIEQIYEKIIEEDGGFVERFYQTALFNLGEIKYREKKYSEAAYYFERFLKTESKDGECIPGAMKRLADISMQRHQPLETAVGKYLAVHEAAPSTDWGRYCYGHALLLGVGGVEHPELERRIRIVDELAEQIHDEGLRERLYLEKGLSALAWGETGALKFLTRLKRNSHRTFDQGEAGAFIRERIREITETELSRPPDPGKVDPLSDFEVRYTNWFQGTADEGWANRRYARAILDRMTAAIDKGDRAGAVALLARWQAGPVWNAKTSPGLARVKIANAVLADLTRRESSSFNPHDAALVYVRSAAVLKPFLEDDLGTVAGFAAFQAGDPQPLARVAGKNTRELASTSASLPERTRSLLWLALGEALHKQKEYPRAVSALEKISSTELKVRKLDELVATLSDAGQYERAYRLQLERARLAPHSELPALLGEAGKIIQDGKLWPSAPALLSMAEKAHLQGKSLAPFCFLAGRSAFERSRCRDSEHFLSRGLSLDSDAPQAAEARYRLGKCLASQKKLSQARKEYEKLVQMQDSFWSGLARNEMKLLPGSP